MQLQLTINPRTTESRPAARSRARSGPLDAGDGSTASVVAELPRPLLGRRREYDVLDRLLDAVKGGRSGVLVVQGEPGVGKSTLLDHVVTSSRGFRVARAVGVESERELPFAALQNLCASMLDRLDQLPDHQRDGLCVAFGLSTGAVPEPFLVGLAALSLLSEVALEQPLLCVIDDAQWLDQASAQALSFVARRLLADRVGLIFATREQAVELAGLPELILEGLDDHDARALLASAVRGPMDERVRDLIVAETRGNPLALLELPRALTPAELVVGFGVPTAQPLSGRMEESFRRRLEALPRQTQQLLLIASAEPLGQPARVWGAAEQLGIGIDAAGPAAEAGLLDIGVQVRFRHPLVRSAAYRAAAPSERQAAHLALAQATDPELDPDRRAWHLAQATTEPDEGVAAELERSAGHAQVRGGLAAAAAFFERAAELTPGAQQRALRLLLAAGAHLAAGSNGRAQELLEISAPQLGNPAASAQAMRMEGAIRFADGRGGDTPALLFDAAKALQDLDVSLARETLLESLEAAMWAGRLTSGKTLLDVAEAARELSPPNGEKGAANLLLSGYTDRFTVGYPSAVAWWREAVDSYPEEVRKQPRLQWQGMVWNASGELLDFEGHCATARQWVRLAREQGALATLPVALSGLAWCEVLAGRVDAAEALMAEAHEISSATGAPSVPGASQILRLGVLVWRGREDEARLVAEGVTEEATARGQGLGVTIVQYALTLLELSCGRYDEARAHALNVFEEDPLYFGSMNLADVIEATVRSDDAPAAHMALARLTERAEASRSPWALGLLSRGQALLASHADADGHYLQSLEQLGRSGVATELARTHLLYGEWLRRRRRRRDARMQLRIAHEMLQGIGTEAFANRARIELLATGERARARVSQPRDQLTPQEQHIAQLAGRGESNADIASQLFISPHTVAYHLHKVYGKLGVSSRNQLAGALGRAVG
jgi:DNA-binding CsgD family transcriptional regulator